MASIKDIVIQIKEVQKNRGLSLGNIQNILAEDGVHIAKSTLSNLFSEGSEDKNFDYEYTIRPVANALLDIETIEESDDLDVKAMKAILKYKIERIEELESALNKEKVRHNEKLEKEREQYTKNIEFLKHQIELKDKRMDQLLEAVFEKDKYHKEFLNKILSCPYGKFDKEV